jgi:hypothetical protein
MEKTLIFIGASHLNGIAERIKNDRWEVINLCRPGFRTLMKAWQT